MIFHQGNILIFLWNSWCWALSQEILQSQAADVICSGSRSTGMQLTADLLLRASCLAEPTGLWGSLLAALCSFLNDFFKRSIISSPLSLFPPYQVYRAQLSVRAALMFSSTLENTGLSMIYIQLKRIIAMKHKNMRCDSAVTQSKGV